LAGKGNALAVLLATAVGMPAHPATGGPAFWLGREATEELPGGRFHSKDLRL
jgi:hypothetical protein